ncbi:hypothetical protein P615_17945 [Brevibacillus laterosporus PE36]|nr:hypothetical protein P615_17945 [Brevibacillus laterosporus PE36]
MKSVHYGNESVLFFQKISSSDMNYCSILLPDNSPSFYLFVKMFFVFFNNPNFLKCNPRKDVEQKITGIWAFLTFFIKKPIQV